MKELFVDLLNGLNPNDLHLYLIQLGVAVTFAGILQYALDKKGETGKLPISFIAWSVIWVALGWISVLSVPGAVVTAGIFVGFSILLSGVPSLVLKISYLAVATVAFVCGMGYVLLAALIAAACLLSSFRSQAQK